MGVLYIFAIPNQLRNQPIAWGTKNIKNLSRLNKLNFIFHLNILKVDSTFKSLFSVYRVLGGLRAEVS